MKCSKCESKKVEIITGHKALKEWHNNFNQRHISGISAASGRMIFSVIFWLAKELYREWKARRKIQYVACNTCGHWDDK